MLIQANALRIPLPDQSVHCVITSPPYWGLRDYGVPGQLGLEPSPDAYIATMMQVMAEVWRVLRDDGTCWVNIDDTYIGGGNYRGGKEGGLSIKQHSNRGAHGLTAIGRKIEPPAYAFNGTPAKNLALIPARFALAAQAQGWIVRSEIIWSKPNPMPESVRDRPTTSHEKVFLLAKRGRYFYDGDAIREAKAEATSMDQRTNENGHRRNRDYPGDPSNGGTNLGGPSGGRNARSVWEIATQPYPEAHFATFPEKLVEPMIKAGTSERGCCPECGAQWERTVERKAMEIRRTDWGERAGNRTASSGTMVSPAQTKTTGWQPTCKHDREPIQSVVLDPFVGSGTTLKVARELGRRGIGLDLSMPYLRLAQERNRQMTLWEA